ncbi:histidine kinase, partial [Aureobasidium melanogenum]
MNAAIDTKRKAQNFIDMISHEMRNPLSSIIQLTESVTSIPAETLPPEVFDTVTDAAHTISICALHMKVIIDEVLDFSKLDSNLLVLAPERTRPRDIIDKALKMFEAELKNSDITTEVDELPSDFSVDDVLCDPSRLLQIIINLITNALKFTRDSDVRRITLAYGMFSAPPSAQDCGVEFIKPRKKDFDETETVSAMLSAHDLDDDADNVYLMFSVTDTGCGLTSEESQLLFQRFAQAPKTYKQYGGSGLGLFISRELVKLQKGQIGLHSEPSVGSRFAFYIQAKHAARMSRAGSVASVESTISVKNLPHSVGGSFDVVKVLEKIDMVPPAKTLVKDMHVLLVEDNLINSKVMAKQLRKLGCEVDVAENGLEALNHLAKTTYLSSTKEATPLSLILLDVEMPIMDGLTCIRRIRALEQSGEISRHVPVIAITANARNEQIAAAIEAGMDSVVTKPFTIKDLVPQMEALVDLWSGYG